jgi:hypothetical protein
VQSSRHWREDFLFWEFNEVEDADIAQKFI